MEKYNLINVTSPHFHDKSSTRGIMRDVIIALVPTSIAGFILFGFKALVLMAACIITSVLSEYLFNLATRKQQTIGDLSAVVTGLLLALNLGTEVHVWQAVIGSAFAILFVKCLFGGIGKNFANPAITARVFMIIAFTGTMTSFTLPGGVTLAAGATKAVAEAAPAVELVATATPLVALKAQTLEGAPTLLQLFLGQHGGTIGEVCILALIIGWIYLAVRKVIKWYVPLAYIGTVFVLFLAFTQSFTFALYEILAGGLFLGAIFMATDYATTPLTVSGKVLFCVFCGIMTFVIRYFCSLPEGVSFSILIGNFFTPVFQKLTHNVPLGGSRNGK